MSNYQLSKTQALKLLTPVVDGEASDAEEKAFMEFIAQNKEVRMKFQSMKRVKSLIAERCPRKKAPESLKRKVKDFINDVDEQEPSVKHPYMEPPIYDIPCNGPGSHKVPEIPHSGEQLSPFKNRYWLFSSAATLLIIMAIGGWLNIYQSSSGDLPVYQVGERIYEHFEQNNGQFLEPTISTASVVSAESRLSTDFDISVKVPDIQNSEFKGVVLEELVPRFSAPMLEYYLAAEDQYIYIYAFEIDKLEQTRQLIRNQEAMEAFNQAKDFHVREIDGKSVVSWRWDNIWYTAISHQDGDQLASWVNKPMALSK